jgi:hypothetical protein
MNDLETKFWLTGFAAGLSRSVSMLKHGFSPSWTAFVCITLTNNAFDAKL